MAKVVILKINDYDVLSLRAKIKSAIDKHFPLSDYFRPGDKVLLKPNLLMPARPEEFGLHKINPKDNVATAMRELAPGERVLVGADQLQIVDSIPYGHKVALVDVDEGEPLIKYGEPIGTATKSIAKGEHVHVHNVATSRGIRTVYNQR